MSVPTAAGTRRVAGVSRRRPRSGPVRVRVGGWLDVITPPSSHMCGGREAPPRASRRWRGGGRGGTAAGGQPRGGTDWREAGRGRASVCMRTPAKDAPRRSFAVQLWSTPDRYAPGSKLCRYERPSRRQAHSVRRALSYPGVDGGAPGHGVGHGASVPTSPATRTVPATGFRPLAGAEARPPRARLSASARSPSSSQPRLKPRPPLSPGTPTPSETATTPAYGTPTPSETATTPVARQGSFLRHFGQAGAVGVSQNPQADDAGAVGVSQNPQAGDAGAVGVSSSDPAAPRDGGDVTDCRLSREAPAR